MYVNGAKVGVTPFLETVPVCSKIAVGDNREEVNVALKKNETVTYTYEVNSSSPSGAEAGSFTDTRDGQKYKTVKIGKQEWMAQNLNYKTSNSWCYGDKDVNCQKYGRLYDWNAAMKACPAGWHLPNDDEWEILWASVGGLGNAGSKLKSKNGWKSGGNGADTFGFAVLPAGCRYYLGDFRSVGYYAFFWSSTGDERNIAYRWFFYHDNERATPDSDVKSSGFSVRCLKSSN